MKKTILLLALALGIAAPQQASADWGDISIVLDPGHGGDDPGAVYNSSSSYYYTEAGLVLDCATSVYNELASKGAYIHMTRTENDFWGEIDLSPRRAYCYTYDSDVFVSFHLNAANASAHGTETWYYYSGSYELAQCMQSALINRFMTVDGVGGYDCIDRGIKNNGWTVITAGEGYPSVLTESLFVDCYSDWQLITDPNSIGFKTWVDGHLKGIYDYCSRYWSVVEPTYGNGGGTAPSTDPYISVSLDNVYLNCLAGETATTTVTVDAAKINRWTTVTLSPACEGIFSVTPQGLNVSGSTNTFDPEKPELTITFTPSKVGSWSGDDYYITLESVDTDGEPVYQWIHLNGTAKEAPMSLEEKWVRSDKKGNLDDGEWNAGHVRNMDQYDGKLYLVYDHSYIKVVDAHTGKFLYNLSNEGVEGGILTLCDVRAFQGKIVACNLGGKQSVNGQEVWQPLKIYVWDIDKDVNAAPRLIANVTELESNNIFRLGDYIEVGGDWTNYGRFIFGHDNKNQLGETAGGTFMVEFDINNGVVDPTPKQHKITIDGSSYLATGASIRITPMPTYLMLESKESQPTKIDGDNYTRLDYMANYNRWGNATRVFNYRGNDYALLSSFNDMQGSVNSSGNFEQTPEEKALNYTGGHMKLVTWNMEEGTSFYQPLTLGSYPAEGLSDKVQNPNCTGNVCISQNGDEYFEAWVLSTGQGIAYYYTGDSSDVEKPDPDPTPTPDPDPKPEPDYVDQIDDLEQVWIYSVNKDNLDKADWFSTAVPQTRDMCYADGKLYVLNTNATTPSVSILDAYTGNKTGSLSTEGIEGGTYILSGIKSLGSTVIGTNFCGAGGVLKIYKWNDDNSAPELILTDTSHGGVEVGRSVNTWGDMTNGIIAYANVGGKVVYYTIKNGVIDTTAKTIDIAKLGDSSSNQSVSFANDGTFWINNKSMQPTHYKADGSVISTLNSSIAGKTFGTAIKAIAYGGQNYVAFTTSDGWNNGAMRLVDVTDDNAAFAIGETYPADTFGVGNWGSIGTNAVDYQIDTVQGFINIWVMVPMQGIAMYQHKKNTVGIGSIEIDNDEAPVEYYNLQGIRIENPAKGIFIRRQGNKVTKVIL